MQTSLLRKQNRTTGDLLVASLLSATPRSDMPSMPHRYFALRAGDMKTRHYEHEGIEILIEPAPRGAAFLASDRHRKVEQTGGIATVYDKDIWLFVISHLVRDLNEGGGERVENRRVRFSAKEFFRFTHRDKGGRNYDLLYSGLHRLHRTSIRTNQATGGVSETNSFSLIDSYTIHDAERTGGGMQIDVTIPDWLYRSIVAKDVLTTDPNHFGLPLVVRD